MQRVKITDKYHYEYNLSSYNSKKKLFYAPVFSDTIYQIDGQPLNVYPKFVLHYPGEDLVTKIKESMNVGMNEFNDLFNSHQYFSFQGKVLCNQDSIYYIGCYKNGLLGFFYSEKSKKIIGGNLRSTLTNKDSVKLESFEYPTATFNNYFVSIIKSSDFVELENLNTLYSLNLSKVIKASKVNDNPVLVLYKLKSF